MARWGGGVLGTLRCEVRTATCATKAFESLTLSAVDGRA